MVTKLRIMKIVGVFALCLLAGISIILLCKDNQQPSEEPRIVQQAEVLYQKALQHKKLGDSPRDNYLVITDSCRKIIEKYPQIIQAEKAKQLLQEVPRQYLGEYYIRDNPTYLSGPKVKKSRPSRDGKTFKYFLDYKDENGKRRQTSLGHSDWRKAKQQKSQKERELHMGVTVPQSMKLSSFLKDSETRSRGQVRESSLVERNTAMRHLIEAIGDIDYLKVEHHHGERFVQACLDRGNSLSTVNKKVSGVKRIFQLAVERDQLERNPFRHVRKRKVPRQKVHVYNDDECDRLVRSATEFLYHSTRTPCVPWDLLIVLALCTGMRRGELLNSTWRNIDFDKLTIDVSPKKDTDQTWEWLIKDVDRRTLPLTEEVVSLLAEHQERQPEGYPYVFVPPKRL